MSFNFKNFADILLHFKCESCLDVGANDGSWALHLRHFFPKLKIMCVEANPACEQYLEAKGLDYRMSALSSTVKTVKFYTNPENNICTGVSYYKENSHHYNTESYFELQTTTLDKLFPTQRFDAIKLDTQGSELDILSGGPELLTSAKVLVIEASYTNYNSGAPMYNDVIQALNLSGWQYVHSIGESKDQQGETFQEDLVFVKNNLIGESL